MLRSFTVALARASILIHLGTPAHADGATVTLSDSHVETIVAGGVTFPVEDLLNGQSSGEAANVTTNGYSVTAADVRNLAFYFARNGEAPEWDVDLGQSWIDINGGAHDFFVLEVGGDDVIQVAPKFPSGAYGQSTTITGWTPAGYVVAHGPNAGQQVHGLSFRSTDLLDAQGNPLAQGAVITGIRISSSTIDGAAMFAVDPTPDPDAGIDGDGSVTVTGPLLRGHPLELIFEGPWASETDVNPNPFLDYRLEVVFVGPGAVTYTVPGFFDGDGAGGERGRVWRARFAPLLSGHWTATALFHIGPNVAVSTQPGTTGILHGVPVEFDISPSGPGAEGFLEWGRLEYVGGHYRKFRNGPYFVKGGTNSPENLLAYRGFDEVCDLGGDSDSRMHTYSPHAGDWQAGDPVFASNVHPTDSRGIIGALNYLSSVGVNSVFGLLMNLGGDGQDAHPYISPADTHFAKTHFDTSRLRQWNIVFEHAARKGIALHLGLGETESANETWLDNGNLGVERKLFYREMVARFGHNPAIKWNLCEENDYSVSRLRDFANFIASVDAYDQLITFHNHSNDFSDYTAVLGEPVFTATSLQYLNVDGGTQVEAMRSQSAAAGHPWTIEADENNPTSSGLTDSNAGGHRRTILYDVLFSGGGIEWFFGCHDLPLGGDLNVEDFRTREEMWNYMRYARELLESLPFWEMEPHDELLTNEGASFGGGEVFAKPGAVYAVYLPDDAPQATLDLGADSGTFMMRWFNPRSGLFEGSPVAVQAGTSLVFGLPPSEPDVDWAILLERQDDSSIYSYCQCASAAPCGNEDPNAGCRNSTGSGATMRATGTSSVTGDDLVLTTADAPANQFGILFMGDTQALIPFGDGQLCIAAGGAATCRFPAQDSGTTGAFTEGPGIVAFSLTQPAVCHITPGGTWNFQSLYRDPAGPCGQFFNLSNAVSVTFAP